MEKEKGKSGIAKWMIIACVVIVALVVGILVFLNSQKLTATTMRLLKIQGIVKLFDNGKEKTITDNLRLANGNILSTEAESLASIALDETKIVTINDNSRAEFLQSGKKLNINLTAGSLFFNVTEKLAADESFDIRTSNMVVGIRGTSGLVCVDENGHEVLYITDGEVEVVGTNPVTKEQKTVTVKAGQKITVYLYNDKEKDSIMFELEDVKDVDLIQLIKDRLLEDEELLKRVCAATGWDENVIRGLSYDQSGEGNESYGEETQQSDTGAEATDETQDQSEGNGDNSGDGGGSDTSGDNGQNDAGEGTDDAGTEKPSSENTSANQPKSLMETMVIGVDEENGNLILADESEFDPEFYYNSNEDVARNIGHDYEDLLEHYLTFGQKEGRDGTSQQAKESEQKKKQQEQKNQEQYEQWQETLERAEEEAEQQRIKEEQEAVYPEPEPENNNSSSNSESSGGGMRLVDGSDGEVWTDGNGNYYVINDNGEYERIDYDPDGQGTGP